ncbi:AlpA family phage regulatory protein [Sphingomonas aliaeris]|uniref:AlpA family phage regulatory protein n=1 Tax=Sphingomonas aliaeris TaxID=2759526 RepID=A0A974S3X9_9SPHN|nr:AlpA family phage regulatory protein [Sphingomonas aliaeris]QQV76495.1 AlpA family phage regulatory protein [Sphingomonas aliaeris]
MSNASIERSRSHRLIRLKEVLDLVPLGRSTIYDRMTAGTFPQSLAMGGGVVCWRECEVLDWIEALPKRDRKIKRG